jgi:hypothetical protein
VLLDGVVKTDRLPMDKPSSVKIGFPVKCHYRGGHTSLGKHGTHLWISQGKIGHGERKLTHGFPLSDVSSVDVKEREFGGSDSQVFFSAGMGFGGMRRGGGPPASRPKVMTDITVRTRDGQAALWVVEGRRADWTRGRLTPALTQARIPYYDDLPPSERADQS